MKKNLLLLLTLIITLPTLARDFRFTYKGQTLTYTIINEDAKTCKTKNGSFEEAGNSISGILEIPSTVSDGTNYYTVTSIGNSAFLESENLTSVTIPNSVTSIGNYAFLNCSSLTSVSIPTSVSSIGQSAFQLCESLTSVTIPNSVTSIGQETFRNCYGLTSVDIPNSVTSIGYRAFFYCENLTSVTIPQYVSLIGKEAFGYCANLEAINVDVDNEQYSSTNGVLFDKAKKTILCYPYNASKVYSIPSSVSNIGDYSFSGCNNLSVVTIPNSVTKIGNYAFQSCHGLTEIYCTAVKPIACDSKVFEYVPKMCKVYVLNNSVEDYRSAETWKNFTNIIGYYVPGGKNESLYIQDFFIEPGEVAYMPVRLRAERDYTDFTTDVYLPEGLEDVTGEDGKVDVLFAREDIGHIMSVSTQPDGALRVAVMSTDKAPMADNGNDVLFYIRVKANNEVASGSLPVWMRNTSFKDANYVYLFSDVNPHINADGVMGGVDVEVATEAVYYNLQGLPITQPERGQMYIRVHDNKASKVVF